MSKKALLIGAAIIAVVALVAFHYVIGKREGEKAANSASLAAADTLIIRDTITAEKAIYLTRRVTDTIRVAVVDTIRVTDTLFVQIPREQVEWADSLCSVYASGYLPRVDSVRHYITEREVVRYVPEVRKTHWGIGVTAGYGATFRDGVRFAPYVGVGISYNFLCW